MRLWLNSSGKNWFQKTYNYQISPQDILNTYYAFNLESRPQENDVLPSGYDDSLINYLYSGMIDSGLPVTTFIQPHIKGFLDYLPSDLVDILQPVKICTQVSSYYSDNNIFDTPDFFNGVDVDFTFDRVFIPSLQEMNCLQLANENNRPDENIEGSAWQFYANNSPDLQNWGSRLFDNVLQELDEIVQEEEYDYFKMASWRNYIWELPPEEQFKGFLTTTPTYQKGVITRSACSDNSSYGVWRIFSNGSNLYASMQPHKLGAMLESSLLIYDQPAPAFVIC